MMTAPRPDDAGHGTRPLAAMMEDATFSNLRRDEFPGLGRSAYLNTASLGPLPERSRRALAEQAALRTRVQEMTEEDFFGPALRARQAVARLIGCTPEEVALGGNTSFGINLVAKGLQVPPGSVVLVPDGEFPANVYPWMASPRLELELVPLTPAGFPDEERLLEQLERPEVRVLALSSVQFSNGYRADLERIGQACRAAGVLFVVDAIQSLGAIPLDVNSFPVDVVASGGHKWLCSPFGVGFCYIRREVQQTIDPPTIGWTSMARSADINSLLEYEWGLVDDARRFEVATQPFQDLVAMATSIDLLLETGIERIEAHADRLLEPVREWLRERSEVRLRSPLERGHRSAIVSFVPPDPEEVFNRLLEAGVVTSLREGAVRIAPHLHNTEEDIGALLEALEASIPAGL